MNETTKFVDVIIYIYLIRLRQFTRTISAKVRTTKKELAVKTDKLVELEDKLESKEQALLVLQESVDFKQILSVVLLTI